MNLSSRRIRQSSSPVSARHTVDTFTDSPSPTNNARPVSQSASASSQNSSVCHALSPLSYMREYPCFSLTLLLVVISTYTFLYVGWSSQLGLISRSIPSIADKIFPNSYSSQDQHSSIDTDHFQSQFSRDVNVEGQSLLRDDDVSSTPPPKTSTASSNELPVTMAPTSTEQTSTTSVTSTTAMTTTTTTTTTATTATTASTTSSEIAPSTTVPPITEEKEVTTTRATTTTAESTTTTVTSATFVSSEPSSGHQNAGDDKQIGESGDALRPEQHRRTVFNRDPPECIQNGGQAKSFLFVFMGHSGSSAILSELWSIPTIMIENPEAVDHGELHLNTTLALQYTRDYFERGLSLGRVPGFKIRPLHLLREPAKWASLLREFETRVIWQYRRNKVKQAVGEYSVQALQDKSSVEGLRSAEEIKDRCKTGAGCSFEVKNMTLFHNILIDSVRSDYLITEATEYMTRGRECLFELRYEDYLYHREGTMQDLKEFLGLPAVETKPARFKATGDSMCDVVENWTELCRNFYGCPLWRHYFEDEQNGCSCPFSGAPSEFCQVAFP